MMDAGQFWEAPTVEDEIAPGHLSRRTRTQRKHAIAIGMLAIGRHVCFGKSAGSAPSPDPAIGQAALKNAELGNDWLTFAKDQFTAGNIRQEQMDELTGTVIDQQLAAQERADQWSAEDRARYKETYQPLEDEFAQTAKNFDTPEKQAEAAAEAKSDVLKSAAAQQQMAQRNMAAMGVNPASGRFAGVIRAGDTATALASAGAQNNARQMVRDKGLALKADAINMGKGLPSQAAAAAGLGLNAGNSAIGNQGAANANFYQNNQVMAQGFQGAMQGQSNAGNMLSNLYGKQVDAWSAQQQANATSSAGTGSMIGSVVGAGIMVF